MTARLGPCCAIFGKMDFTSKMDFTPEVLTDWTTLNSPPASFVLTSYRRARTLEAGRFPRFRKETDLL